MKSVFSGLLGLYLRDLCRTVNIEKKYETKYREAFKVFQEKIGITFTDEKLLIQAFTHSSYVNEHRKPHEDNERLEFLGDAVLNLLYRSICFKNIRQ